MDLNFYSLKVFLSRVMRAQEQENQIEDIWVWVQYLFFVTKQLTQTNTKLLVFDFLFENDAR